MGRLAPDLQGWRSGRVSCRAKLRSVMDDYERCAQTRLEPIVGPMRATDCPGGPPGQHDFETGPPDKATAVVEVTSTANPDRKALASEVERQQLDSFMLSSSRLFWMIGLAPGARVRALGHEVLGSLLSDLEAAGRLRVHDFGDYRDPFVQRLRGLGIESASGLRARPGREGTVIVRPGTYGGYGWAGAAVDEWLVELLASPQGSNKLAKLTRASAPERHLVVVLDSFSPPGVGIPLALTARHDRGAADYGMPSIEPPAPVTHLWLVPEVLAWEGLVWKRGAGWSVLPPGE